MEWTNDLTIEFLRLYEQEPCIWNPKHRSYKNRSSVEEAWKRIKDSFSGNFPIFQLKRKRDSLMAMYRTLLTKVKASKLVANDEDDVYKPTWFAFSTMARFMNGVYQPKSFASNSEVLEQYEQRIQDYPESSEILIDEEQVMEDFALDNNLSPSTFFPDKDDEPTINKSRVRKKKMKIKTTTNKRNATSIHEILKKLSEKHTEDDDECSLFGKLLARKLKRFDECTREILMNKIDNLVFHTRMNNKDNLKSLAPPSLRNNCFESNTTNASYNYPQNSYIPHPDNTFISTTLHPQSSTHHQNCSIPSPENTSNSQPTSTLEELGSIHPKVENVSEILP